MIETIKKSVEAQIEEAFKVQGNFVIICGCNIKTRGMVVTERWIRTTLLTSQISLIDNLISDLEGKKKEELPVGLGHTLYGSNSALTDTITTLKELREEIKSLVERNSH